MFSSYAENSESIKTGHDLIEVVKTDRSTIEFPHTWLSRTVILFLWQAWREKGRRGRRERGNRLVERKFRGITFFKASIRMPKNSSNWLSI